MGNYFQFSKKIEELFKTNLVKSLSVADLLKAKLLLDQTIDSKIKSKAAQMAELPTKIAKVKAQVEDIKIEVPFYTYSDLWEKIYPDDEVHTVTPGHIHHKKMVNHLRHICTKYESELLYSGNAGLYRDFFHAVLKNKILDTIAEVYPYLRIACQEQKSKEEHLIEQLSK